MKNKNEKEMHLSWMCKKCKCYTQSLSFRAPKCPVCQSDMSSIDRSRDWEKWMKWRKEHEFFVYVTESKIYGGKK